MLSLVVAVLPAAAMGDRGVPQDRGAMQDLLHLEARKALDAGDFGHALHVYERLLQIDPSDAEAQREAGRAAFALGKLATAERYLARADELQRGAPDPELHYLRGEALFALGQHEQALLEHRKTEAQMDPDPRGRLPILWLARVYARRGEVEAADRLYLSLGDANADAEIAVSRAEARTFRGDWQGATKILRDYLAGNPEHRRARELLAWVLEVQARLEEETEERTRLAKATPDDAGASFHLGRTYERAGDLEGALSRYRKAYELQRRSADPYLISSIDRVKHRVSPEISAALQLQVDPSGNAQRLQSGVALPFGKGHQVMLLLAHELAQSETPKTEASRTSAEGAAALRLGQPIRLLLHMGFDQHRVHQDDATYVRTSPYSMVGLEAAAGRLSFLGHADLRAPWRESASTIREGGRTDGVRGHIFFHLVRDRLILQLAGVGRRMFLGAREDGVEPQANQWLWAGGADVVVWANHDRAVRGEILDESMVRPAYLADALILHYRHYESRASTDNAFFERLVLVDRASIDEISATLRGVVDGGLFGVEVRAGGGRDSARELTLWRFGTALVVAPSQATRLSFSYEVASESTNGLGGRRHGGWLSFHADL